MRLDLGTLFRSTAFWVVISLGLLAQSIPYALTLNAPAADGYTVVGFPFTFYSFGGLCGSVDGNAGQCSASFVPLHVLFNLAIILGVAIARYRYHQRTMNSSL